MKLSEDTLQVLEFLDYSTGNNLRKRKDLGVILETGAGKGDFLIVNKLIFTGSYLWKLHKILIRQDISEDDAYKLRSELSDTAQQFKNYLMELTGDSDAVSHKRFNDIYYPNEQGAFRNLIDLAHDLSKLKEVQNTIKNTK
jgi:hypothetical protein